MPIPMGDLFAPAYNPTDPSSIAAVNAWQTRNFPMTNPLLEQTRQVVPGVNTGNPAGMIDVEAARSLAQGGPYDMDARRNSIAASLTPGGGGGGGGGGGYTPAYLPGGGLDPNDPGNIARYYQLMGGAGGAGMGGAFAGTGGGGGQQPMSGGPYSGGGPVAPGLMPPQVGLGVS